MSAPDASRMRGLQGRLQGRLQGLYAVTPDMTDTPLLVAKVEAAIAGGARAIQYRNKSAAIALRAIQATAIAAACRRSGILCIVNDDASLARVVQADGVHIGEDDPDLVAARASAGANVAIGVSCYNDFARAQRLVGAGADYIAFGSFFLSGVKPQARRAEIERLREAQVLSVPVVAIGGITARNARALIDAGADAVAVISDVFGHDDLRAVERAAAALAACFAAE